MPHPLVEQLRFTRSEWLRGVQDVTAEEATKHFGSMNCISWMIGHFAWQEQRYWLQQAQGITVAPQAMQYGFGQPQSTPPLAEMWALWHKIIAAADPFLDSLTAETLLARAQVAGQPVGESSGTRLLRVTYHYYYHLGEAQAIRQLLGHKDLPWFIGEPMVAYAGA